MKTEITKIAGIIGIVVIIFGILKFGLEVDRAIAAIVGVVAIYKLVKTDLTKKN